MSTNSTTPGEGDTVVVTVDSSFDRHSEDDQRRFDASDNPGDVNSESEPLVAAANREHTSIHTQVTYAIRSSAGTSPGSVASSSSIAGSLVPGEADSFEKIQNKEADSFEQIQNQEADSLLESEDDREMKECRICQEEEHVSKLDSPCACSGSLKYAHQACIQRWCNEKGDTNCEICHHPFKEGYTAPDPPPAPPAAPNLVALRFRDRAGHLSHIVTFRDPVTGEELRFGLNDRDSTPPSPAAHEAPAASCLRSFIIIILLLIFSRHLIAGILEADEQQEQQVHQQHQQGDMGDDDPTAFALFFVRMLGVLLPCFILLRALAAINERFRQEELAAGEASEAAARLTLLLQSRRSLPHNVRLALDGLTSSSSSQDSSQDSSSSSSASSSSSSSPRRPSSQIPTSSSLSSFDVEDAHLVREPTRMAAASTSSSAAAATIMV